VQNLDGVTPYGGGALNAGGYINFVIFAYMWQTILDRAIVTMKQ